MPGVGISEADMAAVVVADMQRMGYETYEEVSVSNRADIVGVRGPVLVVVECKSSLTTQLMDQLLRWEGQAHLVIAAVGKWPSSSAREFCRCKGFGIWQVGGRNIQTLLSPKLTRRIAPTLRNALHPENKSGVSLPAGSPGGGYFTPFRGTCMELRRIVKDTPGIELREALRQFAHHYASDRSAMVNLPSLIREGAVPGVRVETGKPLKLYPVEVKQ